MCNLIAMEFYVYVDESGDEGFSFEKGSSRWFVLAAVIVPAKSELELMKRVVDGTRTALSQNNVPKKKLKTLHFRDLKHEQRLPYVHRIASEDQLVTIAVLIDKTRLTSLDLRKGHRLYFYGVRLLIERVSWYCSGIHEDASTSIYFSNKATMSYDELKGYFYKLAKQATSIEWGVIEPKKMFSLTAGKRMGLMVADAVASSYFYAVEHSPYGFTEGRYVKTLQPRAFRNGNTLIGYGVKLFPNPDHELLGWLSEES